MRQKYAWTPSFGVMCQSSEPPSRLPWRRWRSLRIRNGVTDVVFSQNPPVQSVVNAEMGNCLVIHWHPRGSTALSGITLKENWGQRSNEWKWPPIDTHLETGAPSDTAVVLFVFFFFVVVWHVISFTFSCSLFPENKYLMRWKMYVLQLKNSTVM